MNINNKNYLIKIICIIILITNLISNENKSIAVTTKAKGDVTLRAWDSNEFKDLLPAKVLDDGDHIETGVDGFGALVYLDDKSTIKIKENTSFDIIGNRKKTGISKRIKMNSGTVKATIEEGRYSGFIIETPTSVATVKGTKFWLTSSLDGDKVFGLEGIVELRNIISGDIVLVNANQTGASLITGEISIATTILSYLPEEDEPQEINEFEIDFEDSNGNKKTIKIRYR